MLSAVSVVQGRLVSPNEKLAELNPKAEQHVLENATHAFAYTHEQETADLILGFVGEI